MKVRWTDNARAQLRAIYDYISRDSRVYARGMVDRLTARSKKIGLAPLMGAVVAEYEMPDIREVLEPPYRIIYRLASQHVEVLAVVHGAQLLPPKL